MKQQHFRVWLLTASIGLWVASVAAIGESYNLRGVKGIKAFRGSAAARGLLGKNGFVVADPAFKQIFEPYLQCLQTEEPSAKNPDGGFLPSFITTDSAWHTYHVLLEEGVKELEEVQSRRLLEFSRELLAAVRTDSAARAFSDLEWFASVGLALQDTSHRQSLAREEKRIAEELRSGPQPVEMPVGFPLSPLQFRAQSFYAQSPELSDYFAARQWYASVVFRLLHPRETKLAVVLARLIENRPGLLSLWRQLSEPFDVFLAPSEDGSIPEYIEAAGSVFGTTNADPSISDRQVAEIQKYLEGKLPLPRVNDQLLSPQEYARFSERTRGFRLLPPRRLPCAACFHNTVDPRIPDRMCPSGLDFLAASPVLRSPAAVRALQGQFGKSVSERILKAECGPMPDSLHGDAMRLLAKLQEPLPAQAPAALRTEAWSDLQLWTQLGAWAEQRHTWALHTKLSVEYLGGVMAPKGMVAPYPGFFSGLATLTRRTANAFEKAGFEQRFEVKTVASELLELLTLLQRLSDPRETEELEKLSGKLKQLGQFRDRYYEKHRTELQADGADGAYKSLEAELQHLARRCAASGQATAAETETLRLFFDCRKGIVRLLSDFAPICDRLAELAGKSLTGQALTKEDAEWIEQYGVTLADFHFYYGNSYLVPRDDFPIVTRVFSNPLTDSMFYAGLARPQALYVIVQDGKSQQLYRGAVMTYREFVRRNDQLLDDESWREIINKAQMPPAPPFTRSFYAEASVAELIKRLRASSKDEEAGHEDIEEAIWQIASRATERDLPQLLDVLTTTEGGNRDDIVKGMAEIIARLSWKPHERQLVRLLASTDTLLTHAAARILARRPAELNVAALIAGFNNQPTRTRRLYCAILSHLPRQTDATRTLLLQALGAPEAGVRWQAAAAIAAAKWNDERSQAALLERLNDTNEFVAAGAAHSLRKLGATNAGPVFLAKLKTRLQSADMPAEEVQRQVAAIAEELPSNFNRGPNDPVLDVDSPEGRIRMRVLRRGEGITKGRFPPQPFGPRTRDYTLVDALIEALGDWGYTAAADDLFKLRGTSHEPEANHALAKLAPKRLADDLLTIAVDKQVDSRLRERALVALCDIPATNCVRDLVLLLDDTTPLEYERPLPGLTWRICDRTAVSIAVLIGWRSRSEIRILPEERERLMKRAREWAGKQP